MIISFILFIILLIHIFIFKKIIFKWNMLGVFFISTFIFSTFGILIFPFTRNYIEEVFFSFRFEFITSEIIIKTQIIALTGLLIVLYAYIIGIISLKGKLVAINHFKINDNINKNINQINYYFVLFIISIFLLIYLFLKRNELIAGISNGLLGRDPATIIKSRRTITSNYFYVIIVYNVLPFLTIISYYLYWLKKNIWNRLFFLSIFSITLLLLLLIFQKRPLILFLLTLILAVYIFNQKNIANSIDLFKKNIFKKKKLLLLYGSMVFILLLFLYYLNTNYQFNSIYEAFKKLSEITLVRIFGRLAIPPFYYTHYFSHVGEHYQFRNIGMISKLFGSDFFQDTAVLFKHYSKLKKDGSLAINSIFDFYGAFGYFGVIIGSLLLGFLMSIIDWFLNNLEKNGINLIFIIFSFVFAYYLSQASLARSFMGYGYLFFILLWAFFQKGFKIKLRS